MDYSSFWKLKIIEINWGNLWCSIPAVLQVIYAPVRFGNVAHVALWGGFWKISARDVYCLPVRR